MNTKQKSAKCKASAAQQRPPPDPHRLGGAGALVAQNRCGDAGASQDAPPVQPQASCGSKRRLGGFSALQIRPQDPARSLSSAHASRAPLYRGGTGAAVAHTSEAQLSSTNVHPSLTYCIRVALQNFVVRLAIVPHRNRLLAFWGAVLCKHTRRSPSIHAAHQRGACSVLALYSV